VNFLFFLVVLLMHAFYFHWLELIMDC
jgi:hypothetical protein